MTIFAASPLEGRCVRFVGTEQGLEGWIRAAYPGERGATFWLVVEVTKEPARYPDIYKLGQLVFVPLGETASTQAIITEHASGPCDCIYVEEDEPDDRWRCKLQLGHAGPHVTSADRSGNPSRWRAPL